MRYSRRRTMTGNESGSCYLFCWAARFTSTLISPRLNCFVAMFLLSGLLQAQVSSQDHQAHHPENEAPSRQQGSSSVGDGKGMMEEMGDMMRQMGVPPVKEIYPSLISMSELSNDKRMEVETAANERMVVGIALMTEGLSRLADASSTKNLEVMRDAVGQLHEGMARFESGLAAHQALVSTSDPQLIALEWFRREMSLPVSITPVAKMGILGVTWFHFWLMLGSMMLIICFLWLYFLKMRRASQLLNSLVTVKGEAYKISSVTQAGEPISIPPPGYAPIKADKPWSGQLRIGRIFQETDDVKTFRLVNPVGGILPFDYLPGQFITVSVPNGELTARRSYTIASSPTQRDYIEITVKYAPDGIVSGYLHSEVQEGGLLDLSGPAGSFVFTGRECKCIALIAGGVGITPLMSVLRYLLDRSWNGDIFLIYGCRSPKDIIFREELDYLQRRHTNLRVVVTVSQGAADWLGPQGRITKELIAKSIPDLPSRYIHICGPVPMMEATRQILVELGIPTDRIKTEAFGPALGKKERSQGALQPSAWNLSGPPQQKLPVVTFSDSNKSGPLPPGKVVLDVAENLGVDIDYSCRAGVCGVCRVELLTGEVSMEVEDGLEPGDKEKNLILACQAKTTCDISVKA
jgi:glycine betaine catabolism B